MDSRIDGRQLGGSNELISRGHENLSNDEGAHRMENFLRFLKLRTRLVYATHSVRENKLPWGIFPKHWRCNFGIRKLCQDGASHPLLLIDCCCRSSEFSSVVFTPVARSNYG